MIVRKKNENLDLDQIRYLPHNFLAEKMILSCLLINPDAIRITSQTISVENFYFKNHQKLFQVILLMYQKNKLVDIMTLTNTLQENGVLEKIGGIQVLIELINYVPNITYLEEYIRLVKDKFLRRLLIKLGYKAINSSYVSNVSLETILNNFEQQLFNITAQLKTTKLTTSNKLIYQIFLELKQKSKNPVIPGLTSGFYDLDSLTQGFQNSDLIIIAGRPSIGKTAFSLSLCLNTIKAHKVPILFFSLEMSKEQVIYRILSMETSISQLRLRSGRLYKNDWLKLNKIIKIISKLPLFINDNSIISIHDIRMKIKHLLFEQKKIGLIIIDYLQLMQTQSNTYQNRSQELSEITRNLKELAREFNIPIIALSQLSRNVENRANKKPLLSDLRESGSIEQDADLVIMISRSTENIDIDESIPINSIMDLTIAKHRNGPTGNICLKFNRNCTKYLNSKD